MHPRALVVCAAVLFAASLHGAHLLYEKNISASLVAVDHAGNVYVAGGDSISKFDADGNPVYSKQISLVSSATAITVDAAGNAILVGNTNSDALPGTAGRLQPARSPGVCHTGDKAYQPYPCPDAFIAKFDGGGNLTWASYLGGLGIEYAYGVATDAQGSIYVVGLTQSADFPRVKPFQAAFGGYADAFVTKVSADGSAILYSTTFGGQGYDIAYTVAVDSTGSAYVGGQFTESAPDLPGGGFTSLCNAQGLDGYVVKINPGGDQLVFGGCLNSAGNSTVTGLALDREGNIYAGGSADKTFPATPGAFSAANPIGYTDFLQKIAADGSAVIYSAVFPGGSFGIASIAVDSAGSLYLTGEVESDHFPIVGPAMQPCPGPNSLLRGFLVHLKADGSEPSYSSFDPGSHLALASDGSLYLAGTTLRKVIALDVPGDSFLSRYCVLNGASMVSHLDYGEPGISPGEIVTLRGTGLGPVSAVDPVIVDGVLSTSLAGTEVLFDGTPAPLLLASDPQVKVLAPYRLASQSTTSIQVRYLGQSTDTITMPVSAVSAEMYRNADGAAQVLNRDYSLNTKANPVARGNILILYMTGAGQTDPPSFDGQIAQTIGGLQQPVSAQLRNYGNAGEVNAVVPVLYAGPVVTLPTGEQQFNVLIPGDLGDSFVTQQFSAGSVLIVQIGPRQLSTSIYVK